MAATVLSGPRPWRKTLIPRRKGIGTHLLMAGGAGVTVCRPGLPAPWTYGALLALAKCGCEFCHGNGTKLIRGGMERPCGCVLRAAFRSCLDRFHLCATGCSSKMGQSRLEYSPKRSLPVYGLKNEEYRADVALVARRSLSDREFSVFGLYFLLGLPAADCQKALGLNRGDFYHMAYRIEEKLGRVYAELQPYPLFPPAVYFSQGARG